MRLTLSDVRAYIASLGIATCVYAGNLDTKKTESIGVYDRASKSAYTQSVGSERGYNTKEITLLVHWNKSPTESEAAAFKVFSALEAGSASNIAFIIPKNNEPVPVGTDSSGIFEYVIDADFFYTIRKE